MKLTKIRGALRFKQLDWMKKYIDFSTKQGMNAANSFEKYFFKLMINSVYVKTIENLRKGISVRLDGVSFATEFKNFNDKNTQT